MAPRILFQDAIFRGHVSFQNATFERNVSFRPGTFKEGACFIGTRFKKEAEFSGATVEHGAVFDAAAFEHDFFPFFPAQVRSGRISFENPVLLKRIRCKRLRGFLKKIKKPVAETTFTRPNALEAACRTAKQSCEAMGEKEKADQYFIVKCQLEGYKNPHFLDF